MKKENLYYIEQYRQLHNEKSDYGTSGVLLLEYINLFIDYLKPSCILDYGCGKGKLVELLQVKYPDIEIFGYDPAVKKFSSISKDSFDFIICTDVLEHIPENDLPDVLKHISGLSQNIFFVFHHEKACAILPNGQNAHCTVKPPEWYHKLISQYFNLLHPLEDLYPNSAAITFQCDSKTIGIYKNIVDIKNIKKNIDNLNTSILNSKTMLENNNNNLLNEIELINKKMNEEICQMQKNIESVKYNTNWIKLFGIYNNKEYLKIVLFGISITLKIGPEKINKIAWWIPIHQWRENFRKKFE